MNTKTKHALELAMDALEKYGTKHRGVYGLSGAWDEEITTGDEAITAIREALADHHPDATKMIEPPVQQQEPLGFMNAGYVYEMQQGRLPYGHVYPKEGDGADVAVYTSPPRKPLTDEQIRKADHHKVDGAYDYSFKQGVRWAEHKHGIMEKFNE